MSIREAIKTDQMIQERASRNKRLRLGIPPKPVETTEDAIEAVNRSAFDGIKRTKPAGMNQAIVSHRSDPYIDMYDDEGRSRSIPEGSVKVCLSEGLHLECPLCGGMHKGNDPNCCPAREPVRTRRCPICGKRIYDDRAVPAATADDDDPTLIPTNLPSTPEARTQARLEAHLVAYHEEAARRAGLMTADSARK